VFHRTLGATTRLSPLARWAPVLEAATTDLARAAERDGARQGVFRLAFVEPGVDAPAQLDVLQPVQGERVRSICPISHGATASPFWRG